MRKSFLVLAALLPCLFAFSNPAGSAFAIFQTYSANLPRGDVICDATTGVATGVGSGTCMTTVARCYGDVTSVTTNITITDFGTNLRVFSDTFVNAATPSGDIGKTVNIPSSGAGPYVISAVGAWNGTHQDVTLATFTRANITNTSAVLSYGTNDAPAFASFNDWAIRTWQASHTGLVELYIPPGKDCQILTTALNTPSSNYDSNCGSPTYSFNCSFGGAGVAKGVKRFLMNFTGSAMRSSPLFPATRFDLAGGDGVCHRGLNQVDGCTATTANASIGATSVTLLDTTKCSRFTTGNYAFMTGYDVQGVYTLGGYGYPPNPGFYDHVKITDTSACAATGVVSFTPALTNDYLSTWPRNCPGSTGEADCGGPATLYALAGWWDTEAEYRGGTLSRQTELTNDAGRQVVFRDIYIEPVAGSNAYGCPYATQNTDWTIIGGDWSNCTLETDKIVVNMTWQGASIYRADNQSMSPRNTYVSDTTIEILNGTGRNFTGTNMTVTTGAGPGSVAFGRNDSFSCTNCSIAGSLGAITSPQGSGATSGGVWAVGKQGGGTENATMTNGILSLPVAYGAAHWAVPGTNFTWSNTSTSQRIYQVLSVTADATYQYITTNCVGTNTMCGAGGGIPYSSGTLVWRGHPAPKFNCVGCAAAGSGVGYSGVSDGPTDAPLFSYQKFSTDVSWVNGTSYMLWGDLQSIVATVMTPYAGGGALTFKPTQQFIYGVYSQTGGAGGSYLPIIDLKTAGTRTITSAGCTGGSGGTCATDSGFAYTFNPQWMAGAMTPHISSAPAWLGTIELTYTTNQSVVNP